MYCICCDKNNIKPYIEESELEQDLLWKKGETTINEKMVQNGIIHIIDAGYGSKYDGDRLILAICNDCIKEKLKNHTLLYYHNYMYPDDEFTNKEIEKSKKGYNRRKNLDDLLNE